MKENETLKEGHFLKCMLENFEGIETKGNIKANFVHQKDGCGFKKPCAKCEDDWKDGKCPTHNLNLLNRFEMWDKILVTLCNDHAEYEMPIKFRPERDFFIIWNFGIPKGNKVSDQESAYMKTARSAGWSLRDIKTVTGRSLSTISEHTEGIERK